MTDVQPRRALEVKKADAKNRAFRTFIQGLGVDILVALAVYILPVLVGANGWADLVEWKIILFSLIKTVLTTAASYTMRRFVDKPDGALLPQDPPGEPSQPPQVNT